MNVRGRSIELFFHDGDPDGITTATIPFQWTGHVLVTNRTQVFDALAEVEAMQPGVYLLVGEKNDCTTLYVGETDELRRRINQHLKSGEKDWWERAILVSANGEPLNKAHSRYLESRIYHTARSIGKVVLDNAQAPAESYLSKAATAHMEDFFSNLRLVLSALRFDFLADQSKAKRADELTAPYDDRTYFVLRTKEVMARARKESGKFIVEVGSDARSQWVGFKTENSTYGVLYRKLVDQAVIGDLNGKRVFLQAYEFTSVSAAASVVKGHPASGTDAWFLEADPTINYGTYERSLAEQAEGFQ